MRKVALCIGMFCSIVLANEITAYKQGWIDGSYKQGWADGSYKQGWIDGFITGYSLKNARRVEIPAGYWLYLPVEDHPMPLVGFYVFTAQRLGLKGYLTEKEVVFGVFSRRADAELYREQLLGYGIEGMRIEERRGQIGYEGSVWVIDKVGEEQRGVSGLITHLRKAIEKAKEIDPTVLNTALLIEDLQKILSEVSKWKDGKKGYQRVIPDDEPTKENRHDLIEKFLKER